MQIAYSLAGHKNPEQFGMLLDAIWHRDDIFAVHIDAKVPDAELKRFVAAAKDRANVHFIDRQRVTWGAPGLMLQELRAIRFLLKAAPGFHHLINLSMQCFPLQARERMVAELAEQPSRNYVAMLPWKNLPFHVRRRRYLLTFEWRDRLIRTPIPRLVPAAVKVAWKGSAFHVLSREFCAWLVASPKTDTYVRFFRYSEVPDEALIQCLIADSPFKGTLADGNRHEILWPARSPHPDLLTMAHHDLLSESPMWFARKFDILKDAEIVRRLAARVLASLSTAAVLATVLIPAI